MKNTLISSLSKKSIFIRIYRELQRFYRKLTGFSRSRHSKEWQIKNSDSFLILAPHPDDESIGCGGLLLKYPKQCSVILITDGRGDNSSCDTLVDIRAQEFLLVMKKLGIQNFSMLGTIDKNTLNDTKKLTQIDTSPYTYVLMPDKHDPHVDHAAVHYILKNSIPKEKIVFYEVWSTLFKPTHYINITDVAEQKKELINLYKSQVSNVPFSSAILGLNHYRGLPHHIQYAEAYSRKKSIFNTIPL